MVIEEKEKRHLGVRTGEGEKTVRRVRTGEVGKQNY